MHSLPSIQRLVLHRILLQDESITGMNAEDQDTLSASWHSRMLDHCEKVVDRLTSVVDNLRQPRRFQSRASQLTVVQAPVSGKTRVHEYCELP